MWFDDYTQRLQDWARLRHDIPNYPVDKSLIKVNDWWMSSPWRPYYLHWDDSRTWPTPWELLADNIFCDLARSLGIVYTLYMARHPDISSIDLIQCDRGHLVQIDQGKYILNWAPGEILNIHANNINIQKRIDGSILSHLIG